MPVYRDEAVVLRTHKLGEADRIVTMLSRQHGKIRAVAKGVRRTGLAVRRPARAVHGRRPAALQGPQPRHRAAGRVARLLRGRDRRTTTPRYTAANAMVEAADKLTEPEAVAAAVPAARRRAALALPARAPRRPHARLLPAARARRSPAGRRASPTAPRCGRPGPHTAFVVQLGGVVCDDVAPAGPPGSTRDHRAARLAAGRGWDVAEAATSAPGARPAASSPPTRSATSSAGCARCSTSRPETTATEPRSRRRTATPVPFRPLDWTGLYPPAMPAGAVPDHVAIVMDGNGRWANRKGLTRIEGHRAGRRRCSTSSPARSRSA